MSSRNASTCPTCGESYSREPSPRAMICSNGFHGFHGCRDCVWFDGRRVRYCARHADDAVEERAR